MPKVVVLCGSTRFREDFERLAAQLTLEGAVVLMPNVWVRSDPAYSDISPETKLLLDELHLHKIDMADEVIVVSPSPAFYVGASTAKEIEYARRKGKPVSWSHGEPMVEATDMAEARAAGFGAYDLYE
jgi:nucleoside 2-deoxyribosyltransferase